MNAEPRPAPRPAADDERAAVRQTVRGVAPAAGPAVDLAITSPPPIGLMEAMRRGRLAVDQVTALQIDAVAACVPEAGGWRVVVDVIEAPARLGDNDMLATYEVTLDAAGEMLRFTRTGRYNRTEAAR